MLFALLACACPPFEDLPVLDRDGVATEEERGAVEQAIADFAAWTGRAGVCVDRIELVETIEDEPEKVGGLYDPGGPLGHIYLEPHGWQMHGLALHELCHALDEDEGLVEAHPDVFPPSAEDDPEIYDSDELLRAERFAEACDAGPVARGLDRAFEAACGATVIDSASRFVDEEVFVEHADIPVAVDAFGADEGDPVELTLPDGAEVQSIVGDADGLLLLTVRHARVVGVLGAWYATVSRIALPTGEVVASWRAPLHDAAYLAGHLIPRDGGPPVLVLTNLARETFAYTLDEASGAFTELPLEAPIYRGAVVSGGVYWYLSEEPDVGMAVNGVHVADGTPAAAPAFADTFLEIAGAAPTGELIVYDGAYWLVDVETGARTQLALPGSGLSPLAWLDDGHLLLRARNVTLRGWRVLEGYALHDRDAGTWALSTDPCANDAPWLTLPTGSGLWAVRAYRTDGEPQRFVFRPLTLAGEGIP